MSWIRIIIINLFVTISMIGLLLLSPPIVYSVYKLFSLTTNETEISDWRGSLDLYEDFDWAKKHFEEFNSLKSSYHDYYTWRRDDFTGSTITIRNGLRETEPKISKDLNKREFWFFGGSTTWGTGVSDAYTYPSLFAKENNVSTYNFGESGYIARQSLSFLLNHLLLDKENDQLSNINVVFYDGANDVLKLCRSEINEMDTLYVETIRNSLAASTYNKWSFKRTFEQLSDLMLGLINKFGRTKSLVNKTYDCVNDPNRASEVASIIVNTWQLASDIVNNRGGNFTAILQPIAYIGNPEINYLDLDTDSHQILAAQYHTVYPLIVELVQKHNLEFYDFSSTYDNCSDCYIDFCHVGPQAHALLVNKISNIFFNND